MSQGIDHDHGQLMDDVYRHQRWIYDLTRKYYLLGRDRLISDMAPAPGDTVLEIACGTGRNLARVHRQFPEVALYGMDISEQMLLTARKNLGARAKLAQGDACAFDPQSMFGVASFDHVMLSYCLSMIPDWRGALSEAARHLSPGGTLHIVDFGDQAGLPATFKRGLHAWLARFHVTPRAELPQDLQTLFGSQGALTVTHPLRGYAVRAVWHSPK